MPTESMMLMVSSGVGVGLLAGLVSGMLYVLLHRGFTPKSLTTTPPWHCLVCGRRFRSFGGILEAGKVVNCATCRANVCQSDCSALVQRKWRCKFCQEAEQPWFRGFLKSLHTSLISDANDRRNMNEKNIQVSSTEKARHTDQIRDFIERLVEAMLAGSVDDTSVAALYSNDEYYSMFDKYHEELCVILTDLGSALHMSISNLPVVGESPCTAHTSLKNLIKRIIEEAANLPRLTERNVQPADNAADDDSNNNNNNNTNRSYEDLLATAILNKVIENYQGELPRSSTSSGSSRMSARSKNQQPVENQLLLSGLGEQTVDGGQKTRKIRSRRNGADVDTSSMSSLDEWIRSDRSSAGSMKYVDQQSLTIRQGVDAEPLSSDADDDDDPLNAIDHLRPSNAACKSWKTNWSLQKRRLPGAVSPIPVPMLVPHPTSDAKVLIGDREADETSDLSDAEESDYEQPSTTSNTIERLIVDSKTTIGGKNVLAAGGSSIISGEISDDESTDVSGMREERDDVINYLNGEHRSSPVVDADVHLTSLESITERDAEYSEKIASLPRTILKSPSLKGTYGSIERPRSDSPTSVKSCPQRYHTPKDSGNYMLRRSISPEVAHNHQTPPLESANVDEELKFKGSYSARETEKWKHGIELKNNPYSEANLHRRLSQSSSNEFLPSRFGRDYYVRDAAKSSGSRKDGKRTPLDNATEQTNETATFKTKKNSAALEEVQTVTLELSSEPTSPFEPISVYSTDSDRSLEQIYNLASGTTVTLSKRDAGADQHSNDSPSTTHTISKDGSGGEDSGMHSPKDFSLAYSDADNVHASSSLTSWSQQDVDGLKWVENGRDQVRADVVPSETSGHEIDGNSSVFVHRLMKKFECDDHIPTPITTNAEHRAEVQVYSLTARSIPTKFRNELKQQHQSDEAERERSKCETPSETPKRDCDLEKSFDDDSLESDNHNWFPNAKSRIAFFENLK